MPASAFSQDLCGWWGIRGWEIGTSMEGEWLGERERKWMSWLSEHREGKRSRTINRLCARPRRKMVCVCVYICISLCTAEGNWMKSKAISFNHTTFQCLSWRPLLALSLNPLTQWLTSRATAGVPFLKSARYQSASDRVVFFGLQFHTWRNVTSILIDTVGENLTGRGKGKIWQDYSDIEERERQKERETDSER